MLCAQRLSGWTTFVFLLVILVAQVAWAVKFDLLAGGKGDRCIRNFVGNGQLVVVTAIIGGQKGDGQIVNMLVCYACLSFSKSFRCDNSNGMTG